MVDILLQIAQWAKNSKKVQFREATVVFASQVKSTYKKIWMKWYWKGLLKYCEDFFSKNVDFSHMRESHLHKFDPGLLNIRFVSDISQMLSGIGTKHFFLVSGLKNWFQNASDSEIYQRKIWYAKDQAHYRLHYFSFFSPLS